MRLEKKNKRSCLGLLAFLAILAGVITWMSLGGVSSETTADDPAGAVDAVPPPASPASPEAAPSPVPARKPG
jgi:hypothetical protein